MNYDRYAEDPLHSPLLNGNASSLGGNGQPDPAYKGVRQMGRTPNIIASGGGGGCVTEGPFSEFVSLSHFLCLFFFFFFLVLLYPLQNK